MNEDAIIVLEVPHTMPGSAWVAYSQGDLIDAAYKQHDHYGDGRIIWEKTTASELLDQIYGLKSEDEEGIKEEKAEWIADLGEKYGWDTPLYRADFTTHIEESYQVEPIDEFQACLDYLSHDLSGFAFLTKDEFPTEIEWFSKKNYGRGGPGKAVREAMAHARRLGWVEEVDGNDEDFEENEEAE